MHAGEEHEEDENTFVSLTWRTQFLRTENAWLRNLYRDRGVDAPNPGAAETTGARVDGRGGPGSCEMGKQAASAGTLNSAYDIIEGAMDDEAEGRGDDRGVVRHSGYDFLANKKDVGNRGGRAAAGVKEETGAGADGRGGGVVVLVGRPIEVIDLVSDEEEPPSPTNQPMAVPAATTVGAGAEAGHLGHTTRGRERGLPLWALNDLREGRTVGAVPEGWRPPPPPPPRMFMDDNINYICGKLMDAGLAEDAATATLQQFCASEHLFPPNSMTTKSSYIANLKKYFLYLDDQGKLLDLEASGDDIDLSEYCKWLLLNGVRCRPSDYTW
ncbi:MAG: hypothetical protein VXW31_09780, partial [Planctomycetota bacterium]|nr:hypothetical protein [Planctomycetota bacterium]